MYICVCVYKSQTNAMHSFFSDAIKRFIYFVTIVERTRSTDMFSFSTLLRYSSILAITQHTRYTSVTAGVHSSSS